MKRQPVESSNIAEIGHDAASNTLEVAFKSGAIHRYSNVNVDEHKALINAKSVGSHFHAHIRNKPSEPVEPQ